MAKAHFSNALRSVRVSVAADSSTISSGPCRLWGIFVNSGLSAHDVSIKDGATELVVIPASTAIGVNFNFPRMPFATSLIVDPDDAATGNITVTYEQL